MEPDLKRTARIAGLLYLINAVTAAIGIMIIPNKLIITEDAALTAQNILANDFLFRFGVLLIAGGISYLIDVTTFLLVPDLHKQTNIFVAVVSSIAEFSIILWFLIKGITTAREK